MRNLKKLLAVVVAICVLATFTVPAFADTKSADEIAAELGVIKGTGDGITAEYLASQPDRLQGAIMFLRLKGLEDEAIAFTGTDNFDDVDGLNDTNKAILAYLKANPDLGFGGVGGNKFAATEKMEAKQYYKVMLTALGYTYGTDDTADFTWATVMSFAASKGLYKLADVAKFTVNDLCVGTVEALKATINGGTQTLIAKLVADGNVAADAAASTGLFVAGDVALTLVSATADNLKTAKFVFNKDLDSTTIKKDNFVGSDKAELLADKKTVVVVLAGAKGQNGTADITVKNVKATDGTALAETKKTVTFIDTTIPEITGVEVKNAKTLVISASEPINYSKPTPEPLASIKVDGNPVFATTVVDSVKNTITVELYTALATGTRKVDIADLADHAGYKAVAKSYNVEVVEDKTAPVLVSAKMVTNTKIEATFDEILGAAGTIGVQGYSVTSADINSTDKTKVDIVLSSPLGIGAIVEVKIDYKDTQDVMGNKVTTKTTYTFKVEDDTALPTVTASIGDENVITLTFSKSMASEGTIKVLKASDDTELASYGIPADETFEASTSDTVIKLPAFLEQNPLDIKVKITGMKDGSVRSNPLAETILTLKFTDSKDPVVQPFYKTADGDDNKDIATFYFDEAMNADSIKALGNFLKGTTTPLTAVTGASLKEVASDGRSVSFIIPGIDEEKVNFKIYAVKDIAGNTTLEATVQHIDNIGSTFGAVSAKATAKNKIEVVFNQNLGALDYTAFKVTLANGSPVYTKAATLGSTPTTASIELWNNLDSNTSGASVEIILSKVKNAYGSAIAESGTDTKVLVDGIKPTATVETGTTAGSIKITFDEEVSDVAAATTNLSIYKDGIVNPSKTFYNEAGTVVTSGNFKIIVIEGLDTGKSYGVVINANGGLVDTTGYSNKANFVNTSVTAK